jgi:hypothetical protein
VDANLYVPDDPTKPVEFRIDSNHGGKVDTVNFDTDRKGKWSYSLWDTDLDGKPDLIGSRFGKLVKVGLTPLMA